MESKLIFFFIFFSFLAISVNAEESVFYFTVNSSLPAYGSFDISKIPGKYPSYVRIELVKPDGSVAFKFETEADNVQDFGTYWRVELKDKGLKIPLPLGYSPVGTWKVKATWYSEIWIIENICGRFEWEFSVRDGDIFDYLFAPIYIHTEGGPFGILLPGWDIALPSIFILTCPLWIVIAFLVVLKLWKGSIVTSFKIIKGGFRDVKKTSKNTKSK